MPYIYIGRKTTHVGKTLWQILGNLKDYGVGRLLTRGTHLRYTEPCFFKIVRVFPQVHEPRDEPRKVAIWAERIFRGRKYPEIIQMRHVTYKSDYQLIPKDEEHLWYECLKEGQAKARVLANTLSPPPILQELLLKEAAAKEIKAPDPKLKLDYRRTLNNNIEVVEDSDDPAIQPENDLDKPFAPNLFQNYDKFIEAKEVIKDKFYWPKRL